MPTPPLPNASFEYVHLYMKDNTSDKLVDVSGWYPRNFSLFSIAANESDEGDSILTATCNGDRVNIDELPCDMHPHDEKKTFVVVVSPREDDCEWDHDYYTEPVPTSCSYVDTEEMTCIDRCGANAGCSSHCGYCRSVLW